MAFSFLEYIKVIQLPVIPTKGGNVLKALINNETSFNGFGEAYFSQVEYGAVKAWKFHKQMTLNLVVPSGKVKFVFCHQVEEQSEFLEVIIGSENYSRITVKPGIWFGFQGLSADTSLVLNIADIPHSPTESMRLDTDEIKYNW